MYIYIGDTYKNLKEFKVPKDSGMDPESTLTCSSKLRRFFKLPNSLGMLPLILLPNTKLPVREITSKAHEMTLLLY